MKTELDIFKKTPSHVIDEDPLMMIPLVKKNKLQIMLDDFSKVMSVAVLTLFTMFFLLFIYICIDSEISIRKFQPKSVEQSFQPVVQQNFVDLPYALSHLSSFNTLEVDEQLMILKTLLVEKKDSEFILLLNKLPTDFDLHQLTPLFFVTSWDLKTPLNELTKSNCSYKITHFGTSAISSIAYQALMEKGVPWKGFNYCALILNMGTNEKINYTRHYLSLNAPSFLPKYDLMFKEYLGKEDSFYFDNIMKIDQLLDEKK